MRSATKRDAIVSRHSKMSAVFFLDLLLFIFQQVKFIHVESAAQSAFTVVIHSFLFSLESCAGTFASEQYSLQLKLKSMRFISLVWVLMRFRLLNPDFGNRKLFESFRLVFVSCNLWMHHGNYMFKDEIDCFYVLSFTNWPKM